MRIDAEGAQVPAKALTLGKLSKLSAGSTNCFSNFAAKTTRIVRARIQIPTQSTPPTPGARSTLNTKKTPSSVLLSRRMAKS